MEQQPGPVNWAPWNPAPAKGMVRLWTWEALAHGAEVVSYFRWRQAVAAQEQMHAGLNLPGRHELSQGGLEASQCGSEIAALGALPATRPAPVAIVYDYEAAWITTIGPQGADFRFYELVFRWYEAVRRCGLDVDFVRPGASLDGYALALVPTLPHVSQAAERAFAAFGGTILFGPRSGSKTRHFGIPPNLPPGPLQELLGLRVLEVSSLRPGLEVPVAGAVAGSAARWTEKAAGTARVLARFAGGDGAFFGNGKRFYLACWPDRRLLRETIALVLSEAGLPAVALPPHIRIRRRGELAFCFNYGGEPWQLPEPCDILLGKRPLAPHDVAIWRT
jgi:beta-galactosidase